MSGTARRLGLAALAVAGVLVLVTVASSASALEVSGKAMKVVASHEYQGGNVEAYGEEMTSVPALDGRGGAIAVLDTGVDDEHPTFKNAFVAGAQYFDACGCVTDTDPVTQDQNVNPDDVHGHGTHVASIALGRGSEEAPRGIAPGSALVDVKIGSDLGGASEHRIEEGIDWVIDYNDGKTNWTANTEVGVMVIAYGLTSTSPPDEQSYSDDVMEAVKRATENDILVVAAAGNCGPGSGDVSQSCPAGGGDDEDTVLSPGATPEALTVGAVDDNDTVRRAEHQVADYSSRGPNPADNASDETWRKPDVVAPGTDVTAACHATAGDADQSNCTKTGTSMATPHVAGLAMIVRQALGEASDTEPTPANVKSMITRTATDLGDEGWDRVSGYGYVDGYQAVLEGTNDPPDSQFVVQPSDPEVGEQVTLDAGNSSDPDERDEIDRFIWHIGDRVEKRPGDQPRIQVVFNETGEHTVELTAVDEHGTEDPDPFTSTIHVAEPSADEDEDQGSAPDADLTYGPQSVEVGQEVWFDANNSTDPDGHELVGFAWDFEAGEGFQTDRTTEGSETTWTFDEPGDHVVRVEVTDETQASARASVTVTVEEPEPDPPTVSITNPQEGDVVETGTVNVTWQASGGPVDTFGVSIDQAAVDQTQDGYLEVHLAEDDRTIAVQANGPGGSAVDRVNVSVVADESLEQSSSDEDDVEPNPPRHTVDPGEEEPANETDDEADDSDTTAADEGGSADADEEGNEAPGPGLALGVAALAATGLAASRRR